MRKRTSSAIGFLLLALLFGIEAAHAQSAPQAATAVMQSGYGQKLHVAGIPNAGKVTSQLYRGAQPRSAGLAELKKLGITTIVDLRAENSILREREKREAEALGVRFVSIPVSGWTPPTNEQVAQFLSLLGPDSKEKVFVHCRFGEDRTGVFVAAYRMAIEDWQTQQALNEMYFFGFNRFWHPAMASFVRDFPARLHEAPAFGAFRNAKIPAPRVDSQPN